MNDSCSRYGTLVSCTLVVVQDKSTMPTLIMLVIYLAHQVQGSVFVACLLATAP
jgi:hypothetical protein